MVTLTGKELRMKSVSTFLDTVALCFRPEFGPGLWLVADYGIHAIPRVADWVAARTSTECQYH